MAKSHNISELRRLILELRSDYPDEEPIGIASFVAWHLLQAMFGRDWVRKHIADHKAPTKFFRPGADSVYQAVIGRIRAIQLAEMVFNLQHVKGLEKSIELVKNGDVEAGFAEIEVGKILYSNEWEFEFVVPRQVKGDDYDLELRLRSSLVSCETKCKLEEFEAHEAGLIDSLNTARTQLPANRPGMIFVKIPQVWWDCFDERSEFKNFLQSTTEKFLRGTGRIVSVKFHSSVVVDGGTSFAPLALLMEVDNKKHRYDPDVDWSLFRDMSSLPSRWFGLMDECARQTLGHDRSNLK